MKPRTIHREIERALTRSWRTLGVPTTEEAVDEKRDGVVDPEALLIATLLYAPNPRLLADMAAWTTLNADLLLNQKLASLVRRLGIKERLAPLLEAGEVIAMPSKTRAALGAKVKAARSKRRRARAAKLAPREAVARGSRMVFNRLLYGASARADIVTTLQLRAPPRNGARLAELLAVDASTVSRVLGDLRACGKIAKDGRFADGADFAPGFFVSALTLLHLQAIIDAERVASAELRRGMLPDVDARIDALGYAFV